MPEMREKPKKVGAFWKKVLPDGRIVYGGHVILDDKKIRLNLWVNDKKGIEKRPDLTAYLDTFVPKAK
jgi:hypothetical protein